MAKASTLNGHHVAAIIAVFHATASLWLMFAHTTIDRRVRHGDLSFFGLSVDILVGSTPILMWMWMEIDATWHEERWGW